MATHPELRDQSTSSLFGDFVQQGDIYRAKCLIPGHCPDGGICVMNAPKNGGAPNFPQARKRHIQKHQRQGIDPASSTQLVTQEVVLAPPGGSLTQEQVDSLTNLGIQRGIVDLASLPKAMCDEYYYSLLKVSPDARRLLMQKVSKDCADYLYQKGKETLRQQEENAREAWLARRRAEPWLPSHG